MSDQTRFLILLGGTLDNTERLQTQITGARVIAADGGMAHAEVLSLQPASALSSNKAGTAPLIRLYVWVIMLYSPACTA